MPNGLSRTRVFTGLITFTAGAILAAVWIKADWGNRSVAMPAQANNGLYAPRNWAEGTPRELNISVYVFGDRNRDGRYNLGDLPLNEIAVRLTRPDGTTRIARSNVNGYANFAMHEGNRDSDISEVNKTYRFEVLPPDGWTVSAGQSVHETVFRAVPGSISGLRAEAPPPVVGLAPPLTLSGRWPQQAGLRFSLAMEGQPTRGIRPDNEGRFSILLSPGRWSLTSVEADSESTVPGQSVELGFAPVVLAAPDQAADKSSVSANKQTVVVDFDDTTRSFIEKLPNGYAGLAWDYLLAVDNQFYKGAGYVNGLMSGSRVAYNSSGHPVTVRAVNRGERFDFVGAYFAVAWPKAQGETLLVQAWRDNQQVAEERVTLSYLSPVFFQANFRDITRLRLLTEHYWQFVVDDMHFRLPASD